MDPRLYTKNLLTSTSFSEYKGFGEYKNSFSNTELGRKVTCVLKIALSTFVFSLTVATGAAATLFCQKYSLLVFPASVYLATKSIFALLNAKMELRGITNIAPSTHNLIPSQNEKQCVKLEEWDDTPMMCHTVKDCPTSFNLKKELLKKAEQEILISGSYCGRKAFDEVLDIIEKQMAKKPQLKVYIITATRFVTDNNDFDAKNWTKIMALTEKYPDRFFTTFSFETHQANPTTGFKYVSNHAKLTIIDRKIAVTGGTGYEDRWAYTDGLTEYERYNENGLINASIAKTFRDQDLFFGTDVDKKHTIERSAYEFYKLFTRWHHYCSTVQKKHVKIREIAKRRKKVLKPFHNFYSDLKSSKPKIQVAGFMKKYFGDEETLKIKRMKVFASGPEQSKNMLEKRFVKLFDNAKKQILINHMYFHPTKPIIAALKRAVNRGVKVKILTNNFTDISPQCHTLFGPRSIYHARDIVRSQKGDKSNLKFYYWNVKSSTNHTKTVVVDNRYSILGSSNFSYKGLDSMSDYEHNVEVDSSELAKALKQQMENDLDYSVKYDRELLRARPSWFETAATCMHMYGEVRWG